VYKWLASGVRMFHTTNEFDKKLLERLFPLRRVFKIYNPFNSLQFAENFKTYNFKFIFDASKYNILWIARLTEQKGVKALIRIVDAVNKLGLHKKVVFNIIGNGDLENEIIQLKDRWDNVNWFGYVEYRYLPGIYHRNNLFISTSKWEAFGLNILEAQAVGLPAIAFDIPGPQDIIANDTSGFLVHDESEFFEKIEEVVDGRKEFDSYEIANSINHVFDPLVIYSELKGMFETMIEAK
jgi:glycosyltransferase involved in cell wall biosynthesis